MTQKEVPGGGIEARPLGEPLARDWRWAAQLLGERLAANGPTGYYTFTPAEWLEWATGQIAGEVAPRASRRDDRVTCERALLRQADDTAAYLREPCTCGQCPPAAVPRREAPHQAQRFHERLEQIAAESGDPITENRIRSVAAARSTRALLRCFIWCWRRLSQPMKTNAKST